MIRSPKTPSGRRPGISFVITGQSVILRGRAGSFAPAFEDNVQLQRIAWTLSILFLFTIEGRSQARPAPPVSQASPNLKVDPVANGEPDVSRERLALEMRKKANLERQAALRSDTEKLFKLAEELKASVDKSSANVLSIEVVKKAEEIEKLARSVKEKMKGPN